MYDTRVKHISYISFLTYCIDIYVYMIHGYIYIYIYSMCDFYGMTLRDIHMCGKLRFTVTSCESTGSELGGLVCHQKGVDTSVVAWDATELGP